MKNENNVTHSRFYIFIHKGNGSKEILYFQDELAGNPTDDFYFAFLYQNIDEVTIYAKFLDSKFKRYGESWFICIGKVDVSVNGYFAPIVVGLPNA